MVKVDSVAVIKILLKSRIVVNRARLWRSGHYAHSTDRIVVIIFPTTIVAGKSTNSKMSLCINRCTHMQRSRVEMEPSREKEVASGRCQERTG